MNVVLSLEPGLGSGSVIIVRRSFGWRRRGIEIDFTQRRGRVTWVRWWLLSTALKGRLEAVHGKLTSETGTWSYSWRRICRTRVVWMVVSKRSVVASCAGNNWKALTNCLSKGRTSSSRKDWVTMSWWWTTSKSWRGRRERRWWSSWCHSTRSQWKDIHCFGQFQESMVWRGWRRRGGSRAHFPGLLTNSQVSLTVRTATSMKLQGIRWMSLMSSWMRSIKTCIILMIMMVCVILSMKWLNRMWMMMTVWMIQRWWWC